MVILAHLLAVSVGSILYVAAGIGLVIFFHELGHFAVAKWCNVCVERFSIGFGPVLWRAKRGETEYVLSIVPFGGYVKMLGQDDTDPSQLTSEEIAEDPRSYSSKNVPQRMAIISAGVIMNLITGLMFFATAYGLGIETPQPIAGHVEVGMPAWEAGIRRGDRLTHINDEEIHSFEDIFLALALAPSNRPLFQLPSSVTTMLEEGVADKALRAEFATHEIRLPHDAIVAAPSADSWTIASADTILFRLVKSGDDIAVRGNTLRIEGVRGDQAMTWNVLPRGKGTARKIGVHPANDVEIAGLPEVGIAGWPSSHAEPKIQDKDRVTRIGDTPVTTVAQMRQVVARRASDELVYHLERPGQDAVVQVKMPAQKFRTLGLSMDIGRVTAIRNGSPADNAGVRVGDKLITVNDKDVGKEINPLLLPNVLASLHGKPVPIEVLREHPKGEPEKLELTITPNDQPGWLDQPGTSQSPLAIPAAGLAFHCSVNVLAVTPGSPAATAGIEPGDEVTSMEFSLRQVTPNSESTSVDLDFSDPRSNWAFAVWQLQSAGDGPVVLSVVGKDGTTRDVELTPHRDPNLEWYLPIRGTRHYPLTETRQATGIANALGLATEHAETTLMRIWLTLRSLFTGDISVTELHGPIGIARAAYTVAEHSLSRLLVFLGFLSLNLAVINFLPIPVLDGGHMVFLTWEAVTRRRPSERVLIAATYFGLAFVLLLMVTVIFLDLERIPAIKQVVDNVFG